MVVTFTDVAFFSSVSARYYRILFYLLEGDVLSYEIDPYSFSPGSHTLTIAFNLTTGEQGEDFEHEFTGLVRERK